MAARSGKVWAPDPIEERTSMSGKPQGEDEQESGGVWHASRGFPKFARRTFLLLLLASLSKCCTATRPDATLCPLSEYIDDNDETVREFFECPGLEDPPDHVACCDEKCCPMVDSVLQVDIRIAMVISLTVICACVVLGVAIVVCCFVSPCPLYDACSGSGGWKPASADVGYVIGGYVPSDMHPLTLNGSKDSSLEREHKIAPGVNPVKVVEADHV